METLKKKKKMAMEMMVPNTASMEKGVATVVELMALKVGG